MELYQLKTFLVLSQVCHFGKAADHLHVSQSSVSRNIRLLEEELNTRLFERLPHRVTLTPSGQAFLPYVERAIKDLEQGFDFATSMGRRTHLIRVGVIRSQEAQDYLAHRIPEIQEAMPNLQFKLTSGFNRDIRQRLEEGELDIAFCCTPFDSADIHSESVFTREIALFVPRALAPRIHSSDDLKEARWVQYAPAIGYHHVVRQFWKRAGIDPFIAAEISDPDEVVSLVLGGAGCSLIPIPDTPAESAAAVRVVLPQSEPFIHSTLLAYRTGSIDPVRREVINRLKGLI